MGDQQILRIYRWTDRPSWPREWPESVGVACLWSRDRILGMIPLHEEEEAPSILERLNEEVPNVSRDVRVFPDTIGYPAIDLSLEEDEAISKALGVFLIVNAEEVERANDFAINYDFIESEGLDFSALKVSDEESEDDARPVEGKRPALSGFGPYEGIDPILSSMRSAYMTLGRSGTWVLVLPEYDHSDETIKAEVLVRNDGLSVAVDVAQFLELGHPPGRIEFPEGCFGTMVPKSGTDVAVAIVRRDEYLVITPLWGIKPASVDAKATEGKALKSKKKSGWGRVLMLGVFMISGIFLSLFLAEEFDWDVMPRSGVSEEADDGFKSLMFDSES